MPKTKTPAKLTVQTATRQARKHVDKLMPGVMATVESRSTADPVTLAPLMVTVITFPAGLDVRVNLFMALTSLSSYREQGSYSADSRIVIYREV